MEITYDKLYRFVESLTEDEFDLLISAVRERKQEDEEIRKYEDEKQKTISK